MNPSEVVSVLVVVGIIFADAAAVFATRRYFEIHPLSAQDGVPPVLLRGKFSPLLTFVNLSSRRIRVLAGNLPAQLRSFRLRSVGWPTACTLLGIALIAAGQLLRQDWENRGAASWLILLMGVLLLVGGVMSRELSALRSRIGIFFAALHRLRTPRLYNLSQALAPAFYRALDWTALSARTAWSWLRRAAVWVAGLPRRFTAWMDISGYQALLLAGAAALSFLAADAAGDGAQMRDPVRAVAFWLLAILASALGAWSETRRSLRIPWKLLAWAAALTLVALPFRALFLTQMPMVLTGDEASVGISAVAFRNGLTNNIFNVNWFSFPSLYSYIVSLFVSWLGNTTLALRLPSALAGALTVGLVYLLGRSMFGRWVGLAAGLFMAAFHFHVQFSRLGLNNVWDGLFFTLALGGFWYAWKHHSRPAAILAGLGLGFSQYFYASGKLLVGLLPLLALGLGGRGFIALRRRFPSLLLIFWIGLVVFLPLGKFYLSHPADFNAPMQRVAINADWLALTMVNHNQSAVQVLSNQLINSLQAFTDIPMSVWYDSRTPMLLTIPAILFWLGVLFLLLQRRRPQAWLLLCWLAGFVAVGALSQDTPAGQRYVAATPAAALVVAYGLAGAVRQLSRIRPGWKFALGGMAGVTLLAACAGEINHYFVEYGPHRSYFDGNTLTAQLLADYLQTKRVGTEVYFFGQPYMGYQSIPSLRYLASHITGHDMLYPWRSPQNPQPTGKSLVFAFHPSHAADLALVQQDYPRGKLIRENYPDGRLLFWIYDVSP